MSIGVVDPTGGELMEILAEANSVALPLAHSGSVAVPRTGTAHTHPIEFENLTFQSSPKVSAMHGNTWID